MIMNNKKVSGSQWPQVSLQSQSLTEMTDGKHEFARATERGSCHPPPPSTIGFVGKKKPKQPNNKGCFQTDLLFTGSLVITNTSKGGGESKAPWHHTVCLIAICALQLAGSCATAHFNISALSASRVDVSNLNYSTEAEIMYVVCSQAH